jgi:hypothetical protein
MGKSGYPQLQNKQIPKLKKQQLLERCSFAGAPATRKANEKRGHPLRPREDDRDFKPLPFRPSVTVPVSPALVLTKRDAGASCPIIRMNDYARRWRIRVGIVSVPADISAEDNRG